jgi:predicted CoA-binding protein
MDKSIESFLSCKRIAVVGASRDKRKFGYTIYTELKQRGCEVSPVNPLANEVAGDPCYSNLQALKDKIDAVVLVVPPVKGEPMVRQAAAIGVKQLWLQSGADSADLVALAKSLGMNVVAGKCILLYKEPVQSIHAFHRFFARLFGKL